MKPDRNQSQPVYPGNSQHQALLQSIVHHYQGDARILAIIVFGSLGRGNWDAYSDIDLDIIVSDGADLVVLDELRALCESFTAIGEKNALLIPDDSDAGDLVLESLMQLSIRYHPLSLTSPNIVESMQVLAGSLSHAAIAAAGNANRTQSGEPLEQLLDRYVRYATVANIAYQRRQAWAVIEILHRMRGLIMEIYARTHGGQRAYQTFEAQSDRTLQENLGQTLPQLDRASLKTALLQACAILGNSLAEISSQQLALNESQQLVLARVQQALLADSKNM